ncbi:hypothetical protein GCM10010185_25640 [Saccharothrix coeruleofusca]|uniref:Uncharacterized protein n=1 Tax=Saccharothrix coeruleofusca TaxID=33919 RepID=A0A918AME4_9PSEU|nr:hypothetical protein [Saccharothrix coeruleofusca]GGP52415.1 hypothetical protein GCM10010185_25640 [Saccharothrix coeruleofusca]
MVLSLLTGLLLPGVDAATTTLLMTLPVVVPSAWILLSGRLRPVVTPPRTTRPRRPAAPGASR